MAVSRIKKIHLLGHITARERIVDALRKMGVLQITDLKKRLIEEDVKIIDEKGIEDPDLEARLSRLQYMVEFISGFQEKPKMLETMLNPKLIIGEDELKNVAENFNVDEMYRRYSELENKIKEAESEKSRKESLLKDLIPWAALDIPLQEIADTEKTCISLGIIKTQSFPILQEGLAQITGELHLDIVETIKTLTYFVLIFSRDYEGQILEVLKKENGRLVKFEGLIGIPRKVIEEIEYELEDIEKQLLAYKKEGEELASEKDKVLIAYDYLSELLAKKKVQNNFAHTAETFVIEGWIREKDEEVIRQRLSRISPEIEIIALPPGEDDKPPIALENKSYVTPFEFVTTLYGRPLYLEYDPTPLLAPFFILFFALCLTDGGYGLTLAALALLGMKKLKGGPGVTKLFRLMFFGGLITAVVGLFTGGWFGIETGVLPSALRKVILLNPLEDPMKMLNLAFALGILQIFFGIGIKMYSNIRAGKVVAALLDQGLWLVFLTFLVPLGYSLILGGEVSQGILSVAQKGALYGVILLVLTQGRRQKNPVMKLLAGVAKLYDVVGYFGDVLSYARLLALGLATSAIGLAINGIAKMALGMPYYIGYVVALFVLVGGHLFNLAVNTLGGFVHSGRLQYLEFFSKFFEGGGAEFKPFKEETKYTVVK
ncbi:MAG: V-type ATP synthase subunit I [Deltaproteobacteria bacterium]|nr:V-type ATP synthase subunit I [Deltaproteobacteria bacterium]